MITITINSTTRSFDTARDVSESWLAEQIVRNQRRGPHACVRVRIDDEQRDMILQTGACTNGGGGGRPPNRHEEAIFDLWNGLGLRAPRFDFGNLVAFFNRLARVIR